MLQMLGEIQAVYHLRYLTCPISRASSDGRRNSPLIGWFHNSLQKEPISQAILNDT
jgi:hypothetical protein